MTTQKDTIATWLMTLSDGTLAQITGVKNSLDLETLVQKCIEKFGTEIFTSMADLQAKLNAVKNHPKLKFFIHYQLDYAKTAEVPSHEVYTVAIRDFSESPLEALNRLFPEVPTCKESGRKFTLVNFYISDKPNEGYTVYFDEAKNKRL